MKDIVLPGDVMMANRLLNLFYRYTNPVKWARRLGVIVGENTLISSDVFFSTEPYLITIGNHVQITNSCAIHTHGGGNVARKYYPNSSFASSLTRHF